MSGDQLNAMDQRIQGIEKTVRDYQGEFSRMHRNFENSHSNMMQNLPAQMTESKLLAYLLNAVGPMLT